MTVSMKAVPLILMVMVAQCSGISVSGQMARDQLLVAPAAGKNQNQRPLMMQLQNQLINLAKEADKEGSTSGNTSGLSQFVGQVRTIVNTTMKANVLGRLSNEQTLLNTTYQAYFNCSPDMNQTSDEELQSLADNHTDCRNTEVDDYTNWTDCLDRANTTNATMNQECGNYNTLNRFPDIHECYNNDNDEKYNHLIDEASRFRNHLGNLTAARANCTNATQTHNDTMDECNRLALIYNGTKATCSSAQQALENKACTFNDHSECSAFDTCWNNANTSYDLGKTYALAQEDELKAEWHSILRIECYLDAFTQTNKSAHIDMCKTQQYDLSAINLTIYPIPNKTNCTEINDTHHVPGTWDFEDAWYTEISDQSLLDNCSASCCSLETTQPTTTTTTTTTTCTELVQAGEIYSEPAGSNFPGGSWDGWGVCDGNVGVLGAKQKVDDNHWASDDTGMTGVELICDNDEGERIKKDANSRRRNQGGWKGAKTCPGGKHVKGYHVKNHPHGRRRRWGSYDNLALTGFGFECEDGSKHNLQGEKDGSWSGYQSCPQNQWVCGIKVKTNEGLGNMKLRCCKEQQKTCTGDWEETIKVESRGKKEGSWGAWDKCDAGGKITGFRQKVEGKKWLGDDTAMNAVEFQCEDGATVKSSTSEWGSWSGWVSCPSGEHIVSYRMKSEGPAIDDTSVNGIRAKCSDGTVLRPSNTGKWGRWSSWKECPHNGWFCGVKTKVQDSRGRWKDDWALSHIKIKCCGKN
eukprot:TRINITY_DN995_c0_g1_i3.p1 TRINITY_DN995_c0_g1~~TRINITY_DN995_c0_g1_i3.p1  ORF type:complete len:749 (-),score=118.24 TRINITY_DN995_c0_g1_i3:164-2410(-)